MGLTISNNAFNGAYSAFSRFRRELAKKIGIPLDLMQGFYLDDCVLNNPFYGIDKASIRQIEKCLPLKWEVFKKNPIHELLHHSDCDGHINFSKVRDMIPELEKLVDESESSEFQDRLNQFIAGATEAVKNRQRLVFG